ncbi:MAG: hypothetical protein ABFS30_15365 [Pseudomonadota bacterium]
MKTKTITDTVDIRALRAPDRVDRVLTTWARWRKPGLFYRRITGNRTESIFARIVRQNVRQNRPPRWAADEELMDFIERVIAWLPAMHRNVIIVHYTSPAHWRIDRKRRKARLSTEEYYSILDEAKAGFESWTDWERVGKA